MTKFDALLQHLRTIRQCRRNGARGSDRVSIDCSVEDLLTIFPLASDELKKSFVEAARKTAYSLTSEVMEQKEDEFQRVMRAMGGP